MTITISGHNRLSLLHLKRHIRLPCSHFRPFRAFIRHYATSGRSMFTSGLPELSFVPLVTSLPAAPGSLPLMEALRRWARALCLGALPVALGAILWAAVAAGEERRREEIRALPELTPELLEERRRHNVLLFQALQEAATTEENVARRPVPWRK